MPVRKVRGGFRYGKTGKIYKLRSKAVKQGRAIAISEARREGHNIPKIKKRR